MVGWELDHDLAPHNKGVHHPDFSGAPKVWPKALWGNPLDWSIWSPCRLKVFVQVPGDPPDSLGFFNFPGKEEGLPEVFAWEALKTHGGRPRLPEVLGAPWGECNFLRFTLALLLGPLERLEPPPASRGFTSFPPGDFQEDQTTIEVLQGP